MPRALPLVSILKQPAEVPICTPAAFLTTLFEQPKAVVAVSASSVQVDCVVNCTVVLLALVYTVKVPNAPESPTLAVAGKEPAMLVCTA